jgi:hypothetical protein
MAALPSPLMQNGMRDVKLFHIAYSQKTLEDVELGYHVLNNLDSGHNDWREYWPIRMFLLQHELKEDAFYGFFSPRFREKTGLSYEQVTSYVNAAEPDVELVSFSPQADMGAFFLNVFEQEELFQPGFTTACQAFFDSMGISLNLSALVMDSRQVIFSNYFVAKPKFWKDWLDINEKLFAVCEAGDHPVTAAMTLPTSYPGAVQRKVFLMERIASTLLAMNPKWRVRAYNTFDCAWSASRLAQFKFQAVLSDALKIAMREQGFHNYLEAFVEVRDQLR